MANETIIDIIRHGEPVGGTRIRGNGVDDPLSERGWQQMWVAVQNAPTWSRIITLPIRANLGCSYCGLQGAECTMKLGI